MAEILLNDLFCVSTVIIGLDITKIQTFNAPKKLGMMDGV
jgi:hypothetical protein